jgi:hypothetical protein
MAKRTLGRQDAITDGARVKTLLHGLTGAAGGQSHNALVLDATIDGVFDISGAQTLSASLTRGDIFYANSGPSMARLSIGGASTVLTSDGTDVSWQTPAGAAHNAVTLDATIDDVFDITGQNISASLTRGDIFYANSGPSMARLSIGAASAVLQSDGTDVAWQARFDGTLPTGASPDGSGAAGTATTAARRDHAHAFVNAAPDADSVNVTSSAGGSASTFGRSDHTHNLDESIAASWTGLHQWLLTGPQQRLGHDSSNYADFSVDSGGTLNVDTIGDIVLDPGGNDVLPGGTIEDDLGAYDTMWRTLYAAELYVETLVAASVLATIGGRIMVAPTTYLTASLSVPANTVSNSGFETSGTGGSDVFADWGEVIPNGSMWRDATGPHSGTYHCKMTQVAGVQPKVFQYLSLTASDVYGLSLWTKGDGSQGGQYNVYNLTEGTYEIPLTYSGISGTAYTRVNDYFTVTGSGDVTVIVYLIAPSLAGTVYFDDVEVWRAEMQTEHNSLAVGDFCIMKTAPGGVAQTEVMQAACGPSGSGPFDYFVYRDFDGTGGNAWQPGDAVVNLGSASGEGYLELTSTETIHSHLGPNITIYTRTASTNWNDVNPVATFGNMENMLAYSDYTMGFAAGNDLDLDPAAGDFSGFSIDTTNGLRMYNTDIQLWNAGSQSVSIEADGDAFFGADISAASTTSFIVLSNAQTYNSESLGAGDVLFGDNTAAKANILWDRSAGDLLFRSGASNSMAVNGGGDIYFYSQNAGVGNSIIWATSVGDTVGTLIMDVDGSDVVRIHIEADPYDEIGAGAYINLKANYLTDTEISVNGFSDIVSVKGTSGSTRLAVDGNLFVNDAANANMNHGITVNQDGYDNEILALKSSDVAHGVTTVTETDTYGAITKDDGDAGGVKFYGLKDSQGYRGITLVGIVGANATNTTKTTGGLACVEVWGAEASGTGWGDIVPNGNVFAVRGQRTGVMRTLFIIDEDGDYHADGGSAAYDEYDDGELAYDLGQVLGKKKEHLSSASRLRELNIISGCSEDGRMMLSQRNLSALSLGAHGQSWLDRNVMRDEIKALKDEVKKLKEKNGGS